MNYRIAVVEDEPSIAMGIIDNLELEGYRVLSFNDGKIALSRLMADPVDLVILDIGLPGMNGLELLTLLRAEQPNVPVLLLTARSSEIDVLKGFKTGAHDYVTKPFSPRILSARVQALLSRFKPQTNQLRFGSIHLDLNTMTAIGAQLSSRDIQILARLAQAQGAPVSRQDLLEDVWGMDSETGERAVDTAIAELRKKIDSGPQAPRYLLTQRGIGYKLSPDCWKIS